MKNVDIITENQYYTLVKNLFNEKDFKYALMISFLGEFGVLVSELKLITPKMLTKAYIKLDPQRKRGEKVRILNLDDKFKRILSDCKPFIEQIPEQEPIFNSSPQYIDKKLKEFQKKYNIVLKGNLSVHSFRKFYAKKLYEHCGENIEAIKMVSKELNHANIKATIHYIGIDLKVGQKSD